MHWGSPRGSRAATWRAARTGQSSPAIVGDDGDLHHDLVRCADVALSMHSQRGVEGRKLEAALALLLKRICGSAEWESECLLQCGLTLGLAADVADDPAQPAGPQDTQLLLMSVELVWMPAVLQGKVRTSFV